MRLALASTIGALAAHAAPTAHKVHTDHKATGKPTFDPNLAPSALFEGDDVTNLMFDPRLVDTSSPTYQQLASEVYAKIEFLDAGTMCASDRIIKSPMDCQMAAIAHANMTSPDVSIDTLSPFSSSPDRDDKFGFPAGCNVGEFHSNGETKSRVFFNGQMADAQGVDTSEDSTYPVCFTTAPAPKDYLLECPNKTTQCSKLSVQFWCEVTCGETETEREPSRS